MHIVRMLAIAAVLAVVSAFAAPTTSSAASGVGTAEGKASLVRVVVGGSTVLAGVEVGADEATSNSDAGAGAIAAATKLAPITISSDTIPALNQSVAAAEVRSTDGTDETSTPSITVGEPVAGGTVSAATLKAVVDELGPHTELSQTLADLTLGGGLASVPALTGGLATHAASGHSISTRSAELDSLTLLDLGALLEGLGLPVSSLSVTTVGGLLEASGISVPTAGTGVSGLGPIGDAAGLEGLVADGEALLAVDDAIDDLLALDLDTLIALVDAAVITETIDDACDLLAVDTSILDTVDGTGTLSSAVTGLSDAIDDANTELADAGVTLECTTLAELADTVAGLLDDLAALLGASASAVGAVDLLSLDGVEVAMKAHATDDPATSVAEVAASVAGFDVASTAFDALDVIAANAVTDRATELASAVNGILATVDAALGGLVDVDLLDRSGTGVTQSGDRVTAVAKLVLAKVTVTPPAELAAIVEGLVAANSLSTAVTDLGGDVPEVAREMQTLENELGTDVEALGQGATVEVLGLTNEATFVPAAGSTIQTPGAPEGDRQETPAAPTPQSPPLPKTGGTQTGLVLGGAGLFALAWVGRRLGLAGARAS